MLCHALAINHPNADEKVVREWLQSNICRCTSYQEIRAAVRTVIPPG
jgi:aerobic-type carbon monoxide dehydrogenase small subunit (CoxS/CutS family)